MFRGVYPSLVTPFAGGAVDEGSLERLAARCLDGGAAGLVALGTTGEAALLAPDERTAVLAVCRTVCDEYGVPLIAGAGSMGTEATIAEARSLEVFADALLVVVPYYLRPSDEGVVGHFAAVAAAADVPVIAYNVPYRTGKRLSAETLLRVLDAVAAVKHCPGGIDGDTLALLAADAGGDVLAGDDAYLYPMMRLGASGGVTASACLAPGAFAELARADGERGRELHGALLPLVDALFAEPSPSVLKACLAELGVIDDPAVRAPLRAPRPENVERALEALP
ncbi:MULTISPECIES: dihydrodipicolinate synthase family protein [Actinomadura]|uniref:dihydrodipicolinate synthase family protein n=1 Tax=Actinomadura TaxID=1988 RepID=UPI0004095A21|nr:MULTISPECIES: dihydrodipicolinate synthase family protein [Actinomadura]RSN48947.1 4-hydroxy-tetrahydrodipicolinate synthase [Actinomadura sp. WAC 06369]